VLTKLPTALKIIGRAGGVYGDFFNFYLCDLTSDQLVCNRAAQSARQDHHAEHGWCTPQ